MVMFLDRWWRVPHRCYDISNSYIVDSYGHDKQQIQLTTDTYEAFEKENY